MIKLKKIITTSLIAALAVSMLIGCDAKKNMKQENYDGRAFYEIFVRAFNDSDGDGIGDIAGVTEKLDYLEELGVKGIWLMPINESTSYHGYDVDDYYSIEKDYGTIDDFKNLIKEAHKRDIKVVMDLVINHTSINNEWFVSARQGEDSEYRDYYVWEYDMSKINSVSSMNTKEWSKNGDKEELYYSIFWSGMPDLNFDNEDVVKEVKNIAKYYLDMGVDGFRLDAAKYIFNDTDKNVEFWRDFNDYCKSINEDAVLVGEVWDSPYNTIHYTTALDSFFEFSIGEYISDRINKKSISGFANDYAIIDDIYKEENEEFVMAPFLRNHDQNRIYSTFNNDFKMKMAAAMYLTLPGTPYIYYGEEIGMEGSGKDENKREPFIWDSKDTSKNSSWEVSTQKEEVAVNVQEIDEDSLLNFYKDILNVRNSYSALRYGDVDSVETSDSNILAMKRSYEKDIAYVIINGNDEEGTADIPKGKYEVVYSNSERGKSIKSTGNIKLNPEEILIIVEK